MENAAKALEIAAGIFFGIMILGAVVLGYNRLSNLRKTENSVKEELQASTFNKNFEEYNRVGIYGSEIFSLVNKATDYNKKYNEENGYTPIKVSAKFKNDYGDFFRKSTTYNAERLDEGYTNLANKIMDAEKTKVTMSDGKKKTVLELAKLTESELRSNAQAKTAVENYKDLTNLQNSLVRTTFDCKKCEYDLNGRITSMYFEEN